jgi:hypothetical protein
MKKYFVIKRIYVGNYSEYLSEEWCGAITFSQDLSVAK